MTRLLTDSHKRRLQDADRLSALNKTALLHTPAEAVFDRAVVLATYVLGTPVGLISLVDDRRQFFKARVGLSEPVASRRETPLSHSFCQYVVTSDEPLIVNDARENSILRDNLAISDLSVIAYLGVPIHDPDGHVLGSFCAIDDKPRDWTRQDKKILENIRTGVESEIALRAELQRRVAAEQVSADAQQRLHLALQAGRLGTFDFDPQSGHATWDQMMYDLWWIDPEESNPFLTAQISSRRGHSERHYEATEHRGKELTAHSGTEPQSEESLRHNTRDDNPYRAVRQNTGRYGAFAFGPRSSTGDRPRPCTTRHCRPT